MIETKVRLSLVVPGATMLSSQDCEKMSKKEAYSHETLTIEYPVKKGKKTKTEKETLHIFTRNSKPAQQNISISKESYNYMTNAREIPSAKLTKVWGKMSVTQRLEWHFKVIAEHFNAYSFNYEILDD